MSAESVNDKRQIQTICENTCESQSLISLFQRGVSLKARVVGVNLNNGELVIRPEIPLKNFSAFDPTMEIFIKNESGGILFKTRFQRKLHANLAFIKIPDAIVIQNLRETERTNLSHVDLSVQFKNFTIFDYMLRNINLEASIFDLSDSGISLKSEEKHIQSFSPNDKIIFTLVNGYSFSKKVEGRLIYITETASLKRKEFFKMGIAFEEGTSGIVFKKFIDNQIYIQS